MHSQIARNKRPKKRQAGRESDDLPICTSPKAKHYRSRRASDTNVSDDGGADIALEEPYTVFDYLSSPYQPLQAPLELQVKGGAMLSTITQSASNS
jgi:hypothetical protein